MKKEYIAPKVVVAEYGTDEIMLNVGSVSDTVIIDTENQFAKGMDDWDWDEE